MTPELPNILISAKDLYLKAGRHDLVEAVSLEVSEGEIVSVIGPNGAGKTSLLKLLLGLYKPAPEDQHRSGPSAFGGSDDDSDGILFPKRSGIGTRGNRSTFPHR